MTSPKGNLLERLPGKKELKEHPLPTVGFYYFTILTILAFVFTLACLNGTCDPLMRHVIGKKVVVNALLASFAYVTWFKDKK